MNKYNDYDLRPRVQGADPPVTSQIKQDDIALLEACRTELRACAASFNHREKGWCPHCSYEGVIARLNERLEVK